MRDGNECENSETSTLTTDMIRLNDLFMEFSQYLSSVIITINDTILRGTVKSNKSN